MTITRNINGKFNLIELTPYELICAHNEYEAEGDYEAVCENLNAHIENEDPYVLSDGTVISVQGIKKILENKDLMREIATEVRFIINNSDSYAEGYHRWIEYAVSKTIMEAMNFGLKYYTENE